MLSVAAASEDEWKFSGSKKSVAGVRSHMIIDKRREGGFVSGGHPGEVLGYLGSHTALMRPTTNNLQFICISIGGNFQDQLIICLFYELFVYVCCYIMVSLVQNRK